MANVMSMVKLNNKVSRNGFDLSRKNVFSAKVGELLPVGLIECIPGDVHEIDLQSFSRSMPINTAAYTRIREYYDVFFVPTYQLWNRFNAFVMQTGSEYYHAASGGKSYVIPPEHPYFTYNGIVDLLNSLNTYKDSVGFRIQKTAPKLLSYLGYGHYTFGEDGNLTPVNGSYNVKLNPFPLLAYQKIYSDYFRNSAWEKVYAPSFNIDYVDQGDIISSVSSSLKQNILPVFEMRYCNWPKDMFMGILPKPQYGGTATVNTSIIQGFSSSAAGASTTANSISLSAASVQNLAKSLGFNLSNAAVSSIELFNILQLRQLEAKQKWAEITQSQQLDYKSQVQAHFGVNPGAAYSDLCTYVGGTSSTIDITEVVNQNITADATADIAGKGVGAGRGRIKFNTNLHGYLMIVYHSVPQLDYALSGVDRQLLKTLPTDYAMPEFDQVGMTQIPYQCLSIRGSDTGPLVVGYVPRYYEYKTAVDTVHGAFIDGGLSSWVAPFGDQYLSFIGETTSSSPDYFKVNPGVLNPIFSFEAGEGVDTDQFLINCSMDIKSVRNLDYNGLPY